MTDSTRIYCKTFSNRHIRIGFRQKVLRYTHLAQVLLFLVDWELLVSEAKHRRRVPNRISMLFQKKKELFDRKYP